MRRRLFLIMSSGAEDGALPGVNRDKENYLNFFKSPEGGAWLDKEIMIFDKNNFTLEYLSDLLKVTKLSDIPTEYVLMVYCGHGFTGTDGNIYFQMNPQNFIGLHDILGVVTGTRFLMIADSCRAVYRLQEGGNLREERKLFSDIYSKDAEHYANVCREQYNQLVAQTPQTMKTVLFADSYGETAQDNRRGGLYSYALLETAKDIITEALKKQAYSVGCFYKSAVYCHNVATQKVANQTNNEQNPEIACNCRSVSQFPFVVVPSTENQINE